MITVHVMLKEMSGDLRRGDKNAISKMSDVP